MKLRNRYASLVCAALAATLGCRSNLLVFTTYTKVGVDVTFANNTPGQAIFGYKRFEGALIPVDPNEVEMQSVFATIDLRSAWIDGLCVRQAFATGQAAVELSNSQDKFGVESCKAAASANDEKKK